MKSCLYCHKEFIPKKPKAKYCSDKCRTYANRKMKQLPPENIRWVIDIDGVKRKLNPSDIERLYKEVVCKETDNLKPKIKDISTPKSSNKIVADNIIVEKFATPLVEEEKGNEKVYEAHDDEYYYEERMNCVDLDDTKTLWSKICNDPKMTTLRRNAWEVELQIKKLKL